MLKIAFGLFAQKSFTEMADQKVTGAHDPGLGSVIFFPLLIFIISPPLVTGLSDSHAATARVVSTRNRPISLCMNSSVIALR